MIKRNGNKYSLPGLDTELDYLVIQINQSTSSRRKYGQTPAGAINGTNKGYTLPSNYLKDTLVLKMNGVEQISGIDYTIAGNVITFVTAPLLNTYLRADYDTNS